MVTTVKSRVGAIGLAVGLLLGGSTVAAATLGGAEAGAAARPAGAVPFVPPLPPGTVVKCSQISGSLKMNPGIGLTGTSSGVKWKLNAVANNCTVNAASGTTYTGVVSGAIVKGDGYFVGANTCAAAQVASNYGASTLKIQWIAAPPVGPALYSTVATGAFLPGTTTDASGLTQIRNNTGPNPVSFQFGGDWTAATAAQLATDCSGAAPNSRLAGFQTPAPASPHQPPFVASL